MKRPLGDFSQSISEYFATLDKGILFIALLLASVGIVAVSTATAAGGNQKHEVTVQLLGIGVGLLAVLIFL